MDLQNHIACFCNINQSIETRNASFSSIREAFIQQQVTLLQFVDLCPELNDSDDSIRRRSVLLISKLFKDVAIGFDCEVAKVFFDYFVKRLNDYQICDEVIKAIQVLINRFSSIIDYGAETFITFISTNMRVGTLKYTCRKLIYSTLLSFLSSPELQKNGEMVGKAIVDIVENEKDPRGVVQVCSILSTVLQRFPSISNNTLNDLVMLGVAYFPVTYITPPLVMGNKDVVTSECVKKAVIDVLIATTRNIPLVLPFLETSLRDTSPNSKLQAAMALLALVKKYPWSRQMNAEAGMTESEEQRWSDMLYTEYVDSAENSDEESLLLQTLTTMMPGDGGVWRQRWVSKGLEAILRSPVSPEARHLALLLKNGCQQDSALLTTCFNQLFAMIQSTQDRDILEGLLSVLLFILLPHSHAVIQSFLQDHYSFLFTLTQSTLSRVTVVNYTSFPADSVPLLLGYCMLLHFQTESLNEAILKNYFIALLHLSSSKHDSLLNVIQLLCDSPFAPLFLQQCIVFASKDNREQSKTAMEVIHQLLLHNHCEGLLNALTIHQTLLTPKERVLLGKRFFTELLTTSHSIDAIWIALDYLSIQSEELLSALFRLSHESWYDWNYVHSKPLSTNQPIVETFCYFISTLQQDSEALKSFIQANLEQPWIHHYLHSLFAQTPSIASELLTLYCPSLMELLHTATLTSDWIESHPFFQMIAQHASSLLLKEFMLSEHFQLADKNQVIQWALQSLVREQVPSSLLLYCTTLLQQTPVQINMSSSLFTSLIDKLVCGDQIEEASILLALQLLSCANQLIKDDELNQRKLRVIIIALTRQIAMEHALTELLVIIQKNAASVVSFLDSLIPLLLTLVSKEMVNEEDPVIVLYGLRIIKTMADLPLNIVFKYTSSVIKGLLPVLDSKQRVIREYAASVRNLWFMIHYNSLLQQT